MFEIRSASSGKQPETQGGSPGQVDTGPRQSRAGDNQGWGTGWDVITTQLTHSSPRLPDRQP